MASEKVRVEDLIDLLERESPLDPLSQSALKKKLDSLHRSHHSLAVPLSDSKRARIERKAAYKLASQSATQWDEIVAINAKAPQLDLRQVERQDASLATISKSARPSELQAKVQTLLEAGQQGDKEEAEEPEVDTTATRAQARSDMFHQYLKLKRAAKIKSKKYHKLKRRAAGTTVEEDKEEEEMARAQERISQRHSVAKRLKRSLKYSRRESNLRDEALTANALLAQRIKHPSHLSSDGQITYNSDSAEESGAEITLPAPEDAKTGVMALRFIQEAVKRDRKEMEKKDDFEEMEKEKPITGKMTFKGTKSANKSEDETAKKRKMGEKPSSEASQRQEALIDQAFNLNEMDEVAAEEWKQEKPEEVQETGLKGWGSWFGAGISPVFKTDSSVLPKFPCEKVIKHTDRVKSAAKYMVKRLPFPFTTREQFDTGHKIPIGKDWNTQRSHQKLIAREVVARAGEMIAPIQKPDED